MLFFDLKIFQNKSQYNEIIGASCYDFFFSKHIIKSLFLLFFTNFVSLFAQKTPLSPLSDEIKKASFENRPIKADSILSATKKLLQSSNLVFQKEALNRLCFMYGSNRNPYKNSDSLYFYAQKLLDFGIKNHDNEAVFSGIFSRIEAMDDAGNFPKCMELCLDGISKTELMGYKGNEIIVSRIISYYARQLRSMGDLDNSVVQNIKAIEVLSKGKDKKNEFLAQLYLEIARTFGLKNDFQKSYFYQQKALFLAQKLQIKDLEMYVFNELVDSYIHLNKPDSAIVILESLSTYFIRTQNQTSLFAVNNNIAHAYFQKNDFKKAVFYAQKVVQNPIENIPLRTATNAYEVLYKANRAIGNEHEALLAYEKFVVLKERLFNEQIVLEMSFLRQKLKENELNKTIENEKIVIKNQKELRNYLFLAILTFLIISLLLFYFNRLLNKKNNLISNQKKEIEIFNENLEIKVEERTSELKTALEEIKEAMTKGQTLERKRLATDLHDNLGSLLSAVSISMEAINPSHLTENERKVYENVGKMIENAYAEIRLLSHNLLPEALEKGNLSDALAKLVDKLNIQNRTYFVFKTNIMKKFDKKIELNLYSIALEICNNILKHAEADEAKIRLFEKENQLFLEISDNGKGFQNNEKGFGLKNIDTRLEEIGGKMEVKTNKNKGTKFICCVSFQ